MKKHGCGATARPGVVLLLVCAAAIAALVFCFERLDNWKDSCVRAQTGALYAAYGERTHADAAPSETNVQPATPWVQDAVYAPGLPPVETPPPIQRDFAELYAQNRRLIGWLSAGESIDYPVVWYEDNNEYYLHRDYFGMDDNNGTLFLNGNNRFFPANDVWLIHGHNMRSGAMFGTLDKYRRYDYLRQYPLVTFRTIYDDSPVYYAPIAAFDASMTRGSRGYFDITQIEFIDDEPFNGNETDMALTSGVSPEAASAPFTSTHRHSASFTAYLDSLRGRSLWSSPVAANADDALLMLITCSYFHEDGRFMLVCRKLRENESVESVLALFEQK